MDQFAPVVQSALRDQSGQGYQEVLGHQSDLDLPSGLEVQFHQGRQSGQEPQGVLEVQFHQGNQSGQGLPLGLEVQFHRGDLFTPGDQEDQFGQGYQSVQELLIQRDPRGLFVLEAPEHQFDQEDPWVLSGLEVQEHQFDPEAQELLIQEDRCRLFDQGDQLYQVVQLAQGIQESRVHPSNESLKLPFRTFLILGKFFEWIYSFGEYIIS